MLRYVLKDIKGKELLPQGPVTVKADIDESVPADALYLVFPYQKTEELCGVTVYDDNKPIFVGVVDEEEHIKDSLGNWLIVSARSLSALLLDNEAAPCIYDHPSASLIFERYVKPYGITADDCDDAVYFGEQSVLKGASCWNVLKNFCTACYSTVPRVSGDGVLSMKGIVRDKEILFGGDGVRYTRLKERRKRCEELSEIFVKTSHAEGYTLPVRNEDAVERGIRRARYLNAALTESPMRCADAMLKNGEKKAYEMTLRCDGCHLGTEGCKAKVSLSDNEVIEGLYISAVRYRMSEKKEYTELTLKRRSG